MKVLVVAPKNKTVYNFRGDLIKAMVANGHEVYVIGPNQEFIDEIMSLGIKEFIEVPFVKDNVSIIDDLKYCKNLKKEIKKIAPEVVFTYNIKPNIYGSIAAAKAGVKHIFPLVAGLGRIFSSNSFKTKVIRFIVGFLYRKAFSKCEKVMFQNRDDQKKLVDLGYLPQEKTAHVDGSGVNMTRFSSTALPNENVFLMTARLIREKGVFEFCEAARQVKKTYPDSKFILLGGYDKSMGAIVPEDLEGYIADGSIEFPGETKDVVPFVKQCRFFVLPTYYCEGLPRTILEAMAVGRPVITTDWPGCRDAVIDGENGVLIQPKNAQQLAEKMMELIKNPSTAEEMAKNALQRCEEIYDVNIVNQKMLAIMGLTL